MQTTAKLHVYGFSETRTYTAAMVFVVGNILLPQLFHLIPGGGMTWLPIYFFTLVGAYKNGWKVGVITAMVSPIANSLMFGMPSAAVLPAIMTKSLLLAIGCGYAAYKYHKTTMALLFGVVMFYQTVGTLAEWAYTGSFFAAIQDFRMGIPGMMLQVFGGYLVIRKLLNK